MPLNFSSVTPFKSQVLAPYLPTIESEGISLPDAIELVKYIGSFPNIETTVSIVAYSRMGLGDNFVDEKWLRDNVKDLSTKLNITLVGKSNVKFSNWFEGTESQYSFSMSAAALARALMDQEDGFGRISTFLYTLGLTQRNFLDYLFSIEKVRLAIKDFFNEY